MFELEIEFGFGSFLDRQAVWIEAGTQAQAEAFAHEVIMDQQEQGQILSVREIDQDDMPRGESFWTA